MLGINKLLKLNKMSLLDTDPDSWRIFDQVDFTDNSLNQFHVDTRDFHTSSSEDRMEMDISKLEKYGDRFFYKSEEIQPILQRLYKESGGKGNWRSLSLKGNNSDPVTGWLKYIRIHRTDKGLVICNGDNRAIRRDMINREVEQEHLHHH